MATTAQRLAEYEELYRQAQQYDPNKFQNEFEREYNEAVNYNKDLIDQQSSALGELQTVAPTLREKYMNTLISDPTAQMALIAQARQAPITQWSTASNLLNARGQRYQDILAKALGAYQTSAQQANTAAENAWRLYQDALQQDQFNAQLRASRGGGTTQPQLTLEDILRKAREQGNTQTQTTSTPTPKTPDTPYWDALTAAAAWEPENKTLANIYNGLRDTVGKFVYENPTPVSFIKKLFNRGK